MKKDILKKDYKSIIKLFICIFAALNFVFLYMHIKMFIGNHAWDWVKGTDMVLSLNTGMFEARYAKFIFNVALFGGQLFPLLNLMSAFFFLSSGLVILLEYWKIERFYQKILIGLLLSCSPYVLEWLYFTEDVLGNFSAITFVALGLILSIQDRFIAKILSISCFLLALGVYPSTVEMIIISFLIKISIGKDITTKEIKNTTINIAIAVMIFKLILYVMTEKNMLFLGQYNMETANIKELIQRILLLPQIIVEQFTNILPFFSLKFRIISIIFIILAFIKLLNTNPHRRLEKVSCYILALITTVLSVYLSKNMEETLLMPRIHFYGLNFFIAGSVAILFSKSTNKGKNLATVLSIIMIIISIRADEESLKVWSLGEQAEEKMVDNITKEIEDKATNFPLIPIMAGEISLRSKYYHDEYKKNVPYLLEKSYIVRHIPSGMFNFYAVKKIFYGTSIISELTPSLYEFLIQSNAPYPSKSGIYIDENYVVMLLTKEGISQIKSQMPK